MTDVTDRQEPFDEVSDDVVLESLDDYERDPVLKRPGRVVTPLTWGLAALVLAVGTFALGAKLGNDHGKTAAAANTTSGLSQLFASRLGGGGGAASRASGAGSTGGTGAPTGGFGGGGGGGGGGGTIGTVKLVDGTNVYVQTVQGAVVKVTTGPALTVNVSKPGALADLKPGSFVSVQGTTAADSTVAATSISQVSGFGGARAQASGAAPTGAPSAGAGPTGG